MVYAVGMQVVRGFSRFVLPVCFCCAEVSIFSSVDSLVVGNELECSLQVVNFLLSMSAAAGFA